MRGERDQCRSGEGPSSIVGLTGERQEGHWSPGQERDIKTGIRDGPSHRK
jgi:hypothetical protein